MTLRRLWQSIFVSSKPNCFREQRMSLETNLINVIENEGIRLRKTGKVRMGLCPFHDDKHPSLAVYEDSNRSICYGCGEKGDAINFIMKLKSLSFREAVTYLGVNIKHKKDRSTRNSKRRKLIAAFRQWENRYYDALATEYRAINKVLRNIKFIEEAEQYDYLYHRLPILEYHMGILAYGDDEEKFDLFKGVEDDV